MTSQHSPVTPALTPPSDVGHRIVLLARDIKLSHSVFALPFALLATFLAAAYPDHRCLPSAIVLGLIVLCMVLARIVAMSVNRWADARLDAANPRTAGRAIPSGRLSARFVLGTAVLCALAFIAATAGFVILDNNPWPIILAPLVLAWLSLYSFTKRFTWMCHLWLGIALALSPLAAVIAVNPVYLSDVGPYLLFIAVTTWVAGFDVIYALQDVEVDRGAGLFSMPARLGVENALWISRALHACSAAALLGLGWISPSLERFYTLAALMAVGLLVLEHALVWGSKTHRINVAFLTVNGVISLLVGALGILDVVLHVR